MISALLPVKGCRSQSPNRSSSIIPCAGWSSPHSRPVGRREIVPLRRRLLRAGLDGGALTNEPWQTDATHWQLGGAEVEILNVIDDRPHRALGRLMPSAAFL